MKKKKNETRKDDKQCKINITKGPLLHNELEESQPVTW